MSDKYQQINTLTIARYELLFPLDQKGRPVQQHKLLYEKAFLNHMQFWNKINKVAIHSTSKKLLKNPGVFGALSLVLSCLGGQDPKLVKSKKSIAAFQVMKNTLIGANSNLRNRRLRAFCYKWSLLAASLEQIGPWRESLGVTNTKGLLIELDKLDQASVSGLDIVFEFKGNIVDVFDKPYE